MESEEGQRATPTAVQTCAFSTTVQSRFWELFHRDKKIFSYSTQHWCSLYKTLKLPRILLYLKASAARFDRPIHTQKSIKENILKKYPRLQQTLPNKRLLFRWEMWQFTSIFVSSWSRMYDCSTYHLWVISLLIKTCNTGLFLWSQPHHMDWTGKCLYGISSFKMKLLIKL